MLQTLHALSSTYYYRMEPNHCDWWGGTHEDLASQEITKIITTTMTIEQSLAIFIEKSRQTKENWNPIKRWLHQLTTNLGQLAGASHLHLNFEWKTACCSRQASAMTLAG
jgi:hypothetical protein